MSNRKFDLRSNHKLQVKPRYIPTFVHEQIFQQAPLIHQSSRCTPTFNSTVFETSGYYIKTVHSKNFSKLNKPSKASEQSQIPKCMSKQEQKRIQSEIRSSQLFKVSRDKWFDHTKQEMLSSIKYSRNSGYSKERKYLDLTSDPVFTDFIYQSKSFININYPSVPTNKQQTRQIKSNYPKQISKDQVDQNKIQPEPTLSFQQKPLEKKIDSKVFQNLQSSKSIEAEKEFKNCHQHCIPESQIESLKRKSQKKQRKSQIVKQLKPSQQKLTFTVLRKSKRNF